jgi:hypothetical protein
MNAEWTLETFEIHDAGIAAGVWHELTAYRAYAARHAIESGDPRMAAYFARAAVESARRARAADATLLYRAHSHKTVQGDSATYVTSAGA